ncbi:EXOSC7, partial [Branchiostoma lanceolatum]
LSLQIGQRHVVDASWEEELCSLARLTVGVTRKGTIAGLNKEGSGSLDPESIYEMIESGKKVGMVLNSRLKEALQKEENSKREKIGFLG